MESAFWIFAFVTALLVPGMMLFYGWLFLKEPPRDVNNSYGYRSPRSAKNKETWAFAHAYAGRFWVRAGLAALAVSVMWMAVTVSEYPNSAGRSVCILIFLQLVAALAVIPVTERALKREFDESGKRRRSDDI